jgi:dolichyl-phosphate-mannose-protein mannosyltransferase
VARSSRLDEWLPTPATAIAIAIFLAGIVFLFSDLGRATILVFDEGHYVGVARHHSQGAWIDPQWGVNSPRPYNFEHPPLAKYLIAASVHYVGDNPIGWRLPSVLFGAFGLAGAYLVGRNLFRAHEAGILAAGLLALDPMYYTHARLAVLEIFPTVLLTWSLAMACNPSRPRLLASGIFLGLACATKYSALFFGPPLLLIAMARVGAPRKNLGRLAAAYFGAPATMVLLAYLPYFDIWLRELGALGTVKFFVWMQREILLYNYGAALTHDYVSSPLSWFILAVPMAYYWNISADGLRQGWIYAFGNVTTWWVGLAGLARALPALLRRPSFALWYPIPLAALALFFTLGFAPFLVVKRILLIFYLTAYTPVLAIAAAGVVHSLWRRGGISGFMAVILVALMGATFVAFYPVASGAPVHPSQIEWIFNVLPWMNRLPVPGAYAPSG